MTNLTISIITPSFNQGKFIARTINSALSQDFLPTEYFVMDGGSTDQTLDVLKQYQDKIAWISEPDHGQAHAVNKGFKKATSDIIGWLNSDDIYYPQALQKIMQFFQDHPDCDVVYGMANHIDANDNIIEAYPTEAWNIDRLKKTCFLCQPAVFFRRRVFEQFGFLNEDLNFCMDYEYWLRMALKGARFSFLPSVLAGSRLHEETKTLSAPLRAQKEAVLMLLKKLGYIPLAWLKTYVITYLKAKTGLRSINIIRGNQTP